MKKLFLTGAAIAIAGAALAQIDTSKTVVVINGEEIKGQEYYHRMEYLPGVGKQIGTSFVQFPPGFFTIEQLITERLLLQLAKNKNVYPTDIEVQAEATRQTTEDPKLMTEWLASGRTKDEFNYQVRLQLARFKVQTAGVTVTDQDVDNYYKKNPDKFVIPKQAKIRIIAVGSTDDTKAVDADLAAGKSFAEVAKARSQDLSRSTGGEMGWVAFSNLPTPVRTVVTATKIGQVSTWAETDVPQGKLYLKAFVEDIKAEQKQTLDANLRRAVRRDLMLLEGSKKNNVSTEMLQLRAKAKIDIKDKAFAEAYKQYMDQFLRNVGGGS